MKVVASYSIKGGVGKTAASVNLSFASAEMGQRTLLIDLDPQGASSYYFRIKPSSKLKSKGFFKDQERFEDSIRASDYDYLDVLPANMAFRKLETVLDQMAKPLKQLRRTLRNIEDQYDVVVLDCPPNIGILSENVFVASDLIVVPVIPTTLSERTFGQLLEFFKKQNYPQKNIVAFFSMVQTNNRLHRETIHRLRQQSTHFLETIVPMSVDIERMGLSREPVLCRTGTRRAAIAYRNLCGEILGRLD